MPSRFVNSYLIRKWCFVCRDEPPSTDCRQKYCSLGIGCVQVSTHSSQGSELGRHLESLYVELELMGQFQWNERSKDSLILLSTCFCNKIQLSKEEKNVWKVSKRTPLRLFSNASWEKIYHNFSYQGYTRTFVFCCKNWKPQQNINSHRTWYF